MEVSKVFQQHMISLNARWNCWKVCCVLFVPNGSTPLGIKSFESLSILKCFKHCCKNNNFEKKDLKMIILLFQMIITPINYIYTKWHYAKRGRPVPNMRKMFASPLNGIAKPWNREISLQTKQLPPSQKRISKKVKTVLRPSVALRV